MRLLSLNTTGEVCLTFMLTTEHGGVKRKEMVQGVDQWVI